jgi:methylenetetrahydrofolate dehydrogenase (NADP+) / methenyltetrahydrofolate cyclohydrolase
MSARLLDGLAVAARIRDELRPRIAAFAARAGRPPGLGIVLVGDDPASHLYVRNKIKSGTDVGFRADLHQLPATAPLEEVIALVQRLNDSDVHDGILVQSPLPAAMGPGAERTIFDLIDPRKDVDGFSPVNVGHLVQKRAALAACTPAGVVQLLDHYGIAISGRRAVVIGRSDIVGKPMALMLMHRDATVTVCHSRTRDLPAVAREADILVAAIGRAVFVTPDFVKPGATVIDVGMNRLEDTAVVDGVFPKGTARREQFEKRGSLLVGDVHPGVAQVAGAMTPVPGGVGPLTIAMLMHNTLLAAEVRAGTGHEVRVETGH